jgi:hypothetical protein
MSQDTPDTEPQDDSQNKAIRNLYAEVLNSCINDLRRGLPDFVEAMQFQNSKDEATKLRRLAIAWVYNQHDSVISFEECLMALNLCGGSFITAMTEQGLLFVEKSEEEAAIESEESVAA